MSFELKNVSYKRYKTLIFDDLSFNVDNKQILGMTFDNKILAKYLIKIILGKKKLDTGSLHLNGNNITAWLPKERQIAYISSSNFYIGFLPTKLRLTYHLLTQPKFVYDANIKYNENKFSLKKLQMIGYNAQKINLFEMLERIIKQFINDSLKIKEDWMKNYLDNIETFHDRTIIKALGEENKNSIIFHTVKNYIMKKEELRVREGYLSFLQSLLDKIDYIADLDYSCRCIITAKKAKIKDKIFSFSEIKLVCEKYDKILRTMIWFERYKLIRSRKILRKHYFSLYKTLIKDKSIHLKWQSIFDKSFNKQVKIWLKLSDDQWYEYNKKQEQLSTTLLPDEASIIKGKVFEYYHKLHIKTLNSELEEQYIDLDDDIEKAKDLVENVYNQAYQYVKNLMDDLNIKMNWFKFTKNLSNFDMIKIKLINAILKKRELIIFNNTFDNLTQNEAKELHEIVDAIKEYNKKIGFIFMSKSFQYIIDYCDNYTNISSSKEKAEIQNVEQARILPKDLETYKLIYSESQNIFNCVYEPDKHQLLLNDLQIDLSKKVKLGVKSNNFYLAINPSLVSFEKQSDYNKELGLTIKGEITSFKKRYRFNLFTFKTRENLTIIVQSNKTYTKLNKINTIYFAKDSLLIYDKDSGQLIEKI